MPHSAWFLSLERDKKNLTPLSFLRIYNLAHLAFYASFELPSGFRKKIGRP
jgi:hypothetical protein